MMIEYDNAGKSFIWKQNDITSVFLITNEYMKQYLNGYLIASNGTVNGKYIFAIYINL